MTRLLAFVSKTFGLNAEDGGTLGALLLLEH